MFTELPISAMSDKSLLALAAVIRDELAGHAHKNRFLVEALEDIGGEFVRRHKLISLAFVSKALGTEA